MVQTTSATGAGRFRVVAIVLAALLALAAVGAVEAHALSGKVDTYKHGKGVLKVKKKGGKIVKVKTSARVKVELVGRKGKTSAADVNELVPGAKVLDTERTRGRITTIEIRELPSGSSDCSFDMSEDAEDIDESFDCSSGYEDEEQVCSFDQSGDSSPGDESKDSSWDCSYEDQNLSWECSFDSSQSSSTGPDGGDADGDFSFDCSWESEQELDGPLWECELDPAAMAFNCGSQLLDQEFGAQLDTAGIGVSLDSFLDFSTDYVEDGEDETVACSAAGGSLDCSFDGSGEAGDCEFDFSFDRSHEPGYVEGDVSGDGSMSCSYDADQSGDDSAGEGDDA